MTSPTTKVPKSGKTKQSHAAMVGDTVAPKTSSDAVSSEAIQPKPATTKKIRIIKAPTAPEDNKIYLKYWTG